MQVSSTHVPKHKEEGSEPPNYYTNHPERRFFCQNRLQRKDEGEKRNERLKRKFCRVIQVEIEITAQ